jgi:hypothetical protein
MVIIPYYDDSPPPFQDVLFRLILHWKRSFLQAHLVLDNQQFRNIPPTPSPVTDDSPLLEPS